MRNKNDYGYPKENHVNNIYVNDQGIVNKNYNPFDPIDESEHCMLQMK